MILELRALGLQVESQKPIIVYYNRQPVGEYVADLMVDEKVIVELKAARQISQEHKAQLLNYLKATAVEVGLLLNFGMTPEFDRFVFDNSKKGSLGWMKPE